MLDPAALIAIGRDVSQRRLLDEQQRRADFQTLQFQAALLELARTESSCLQDFLLHVTALAAATLDVARASVWVYNDTHTEMHCAHLFDRERNLHESGDCPGGAMLSALFWRSAEAPDHRDERHPNGPA